MKRYWLLRFIFSADFAFVKFAAGVLATSSRWFLALNIFLLLKRCEFQKEASGTNLIPPLVSGPRTFYSPH